MQTGIDTPRHPDTDAIDAPANADAMRPHIFGESDEPRQPVTLQEVQTAIWDNLA